VAFFSYNLARNFLHNRLVTEDAYVCGLLHDLGKIVFSTMYPELLERIQGLKEKHNIPDKVYNALLEGSDHSEIGAALAEKWNFPESLINAIRYHHSIDSAPEDYYDLASTICLADRLVHYHEGKLEFYQIDPTLLSRFNLHSEAQVQKLCTNFQRAFMTEQGK
jgi:putative nucleotidyltransferase with HDIG domain